MGEVKTNLIFDASGLNWLADDPDSTAMLKCIGLGFWVRVTETNIAEIGASKAERRWLLIETCRRLQISGECIRPYHWIIGQMVKLHAACPDRFHWQRIGVRAPELESEVARPKFLNNDAITDEVRVVSQINNAEFDQIFRDVREMFPIPPRERIQFTLGRVVEELERDGSPHWQTAADIYQRYAGVRPTETEIRAFIEVCPPLRAMMLGIGLAQFNGSVRDFRLPAQYKGVGRLDLASAVYLPYCDCFITGAESQCNALRDIGEIAGLGTMVLPYADFRKSWLLAA